MITQAAGVVAERVSSMGGLRRDAGGESALERVSKRSTPGSVMIER